MDSNILPIPASVVSNLFVDEFKKYLGVKLKLGTRNYSRQIQIFSTTEYGGRKKFLLSFSALKQNFGNGKDGIRRSQN